MSLFSAEDFKRLVENDRELMTELIRLYQEEKGKELPRLEEAIAQQDGAATEKISHKLKGNLRNFYAHEVTEIAERIEYAGRDNRFEGLSAQYKIFKSKLEELDQQLQDFLKLES